MRTPWLSKMVGKPPQVSDSTKERPSTSIHLLNCFKFLLCMGRLSHSCSDWTMKRSWTAAQMCAQRCTVVPIGQTSHYLQQLLKPLRLPAASIIAEQTPILPASLTECDCSAWVDLPWYSADRDFQSPRGKWMTHIFYASSLHSELAPAICSYL